MDILYLLIPLSLVFVFLIALVFWWSLKSGQYEDLEGPGFRILMDDDSVAYEQANKDQPKPRAESDHQDKSS